MVRTLSPHQRLYLSRARDIAAYLLAQLGMDEVDFKRVPPQCGRVFEKHGVRISVPSIQRYVFLRNVKTGQKSKVSRRGSDHITRLAYAIMDLTPSLPSRKQREL